jgi:hypothetical protein
MLEATLSKPALSVTLSSTIHPAYKYWEVGHPKRGSPCEQHLSATMVADLRSADCQTCAQQGINILKTVASSTTWHKTTGHCHNILRYDKDTKIWLISYLCDRSSLETEPIQNNLCCHIILPAGCIKHCMNTHVRSTITSCVKISMFADTFAIIARL